MSSSSQISSLVNPDSSLSLYHLLEPDVLANPYPLYHRLRAEDPVHWDPYLHSWVVTRYKDVVTVLQNFSAARIPTPVQLRDLGLSELEPVANVMARQMLFLDAHAHSRFRNLVTAAFSPAKVEALRRHIQEITDNLIDAIVAKGRMDVIADFADPLPATVTAELLGVPVEDRSQLKAWSKDFSEMLGNFQLNPGRTSVMLKTLELMTDYFRRRMRANAQPSQEGVLHAFINAEIDGERLTEEEVIANSVVTLVGGLETTSNLIGNGVLSLLRNPRELETLRANPSFYPSTIEELLRYESPIQYTSRLAPADVDLGGKLIRRQQAVIAVVGAANHDPERFREPDRLDITRQDNRHLAFGWAAHSCFGAPLARVEGQIAFSTMLRRLRNLALDTTNLVWRTNMGFRGLEALPVTFEPA